MKSLLINEINLPNNKKRNISISKNRKIKIKPTSLINITNHILLDLKGKEKIKI